MADEIQDAEWEEVPGNDGALHVKPLRPDPRVSHDPRPSSTEPTPKPRRPFWQTALRSGCIVVLLTFGFILMLGLIAPSASEDSQATETSSPADGSSPQGKSADDMASDWAEFVTGDRDGGPFALTDGSGKPGEFCTSSKGSSFMRFGGKVLGQPVSDYYMKFDLKRPVAEAGAYWFDAGKNQLSAVRLARGNTNMDGHTAIPDQHMLVTRFERGVVVIDATPFHVCVP